MYTQEVADAICEHLADGLSLREICRMDGMPGRATVFRWLGENEAFRDQYARAKAEGLEALAEDILDISDNATNDWMRRNGGDGDPGWVANGEGIQRSRLRVDSRKWLLSKLVPKKYGDRQVIAGDPEAPLKHDHTVGLQPETARLLAGLSAGSGDTGTEAPVPD
jgi:hypothetical protein